MVTLLPVPSAFTVTVGMVPANVSVLAGVLLLSIVQPAAEVVSVSPKIMVPIVRGESRLDGHIARDVLLAKVIRHAATTADDII